MKRIIILLLACTSLAYSVDKVYTKPFAYPDGRLEIAVIPSLTKYFGEFTDNNVGFTGALQTRYAFPFIPELGLGARFGHGFLYYDRRYRARFGTNFEAQFNQDRFPDAINQTVGRTTKVTTFDFFFNLNLFPRSIVNYHLFAGAGILSFQPKDIMDNPITPSGERTDYPEFKDESEFDFHLMGGLGIDWYVSKNFSVGFNVLYRKLNTDWLDAYAQRNADSSKTETDAYSEVGLKFAFFLFGDDDYDGDGLSNEDEEKFGTDPFGYDTDDDGVSDFDEIAVHNSDPKKTDSDGDGLSDGEEVVNNTSLFEKDTDKDGLGDYDETTIYHTNPKERDSDFDSLTDPQELALGTNPMNGDTDGDGVSDSKDKCPSVFGIRETEGCPAPPEKLVEERLVRDTVYAPAKTDTVVIVQQVEKIKEGQIYSPKGINFQRGSADILIESEPILDDIVAWLQKERKLKLEIQGHTDSDGPDIGNDELSLARADAVRNYLIMNGIDSSRLTTRGYGETKPLDTSGTDKAKAKNRRIEFKVIKNI